MDESKILKKMNDHGQTSSFLWNIFFSAKKKFVNQKRVELNFCNAGCYNYTIYACFLNL